MKKIIFFLFLALLGITSQAQNVRVNQIKSTGQPEGKIVVTNGTTEHLKISTVSLSDLGVGTVTNVTATSPIFSSGGATPNITIQAATSTQTGSMSATDKVKIDSDTDQSPTNERNTSALYDKITHIFSITDSGGSVGDTILTSTVDSLKFTGTGTKTLSLYQNGVPTSGTFTDLSGEIVNCFIGTETVTATNNSIVFADSFSSVGYFVNLRAWYNENISGKVVQISNPIYDFNKTLSGFTFKVDTVAGFYTYMAVDSVNLYPLEFSNYVAKNSPVTAATNTKITYDAKGLVTGSASATATDIVNTPSGTVTGTTVQYAINGLENLKVPYTGAITDVDLDTMALRTGYIDLVQDTKPTHSAYRLFADTTAHTLGFYNDESDITMQIGSEMWSRVYNDSGTDKLNGTVVRITGSNGDIPTINIASNDYHVNADGVLGVATHDIESNTYGFITTIGEVHGLDTSGCPEGAILYLGLNGAYTHIRPIAPNFVIEIGTCLYSHATDGTIMINIKGSPYDITHNSFNDIFLESMKFTVTSNGTTTTGNLERVGGGDLTMQFSSGFTTLDCTPAATVVLTAGTATIPQTNYVYVPKSTGVLTASTSGWPSDEHIKVSEVACRTSALTQSDGVLRNQNWNDHISGSNGSGHVSHINERIRRLNAEWYSGVDPTFTIVSASTPDNLYFSNTGGKVYQMHLQDFPAMSMPTSDIHVVNHPTTPYTAVSDLNTQLTDALGVTMASKSYSLVIWGIQNETGELSHLMVNLPIGSYLSAANAIKDADNYSVYTIPSQFKGVGFLIARVTLSHNPSSSGTWTLEQTQDLRGFYPNNTAGSGASGSGSGVTTYLGLLDTPNSYSGSSNKLQGVNSGETAIESKAMTVTLAGTANIPTGQQYQINGGSIIVDAINDAVTTTAPSQNAVFDAIATVTTLADKVKYNVSDASSGYLADKIVAGTGISLAEGTGGDADKLVITSTATGGSAEIWTALSGTYASATTFTITGTDKDVGLLELSLLTCTNSTGATRRIGYIKTATNSSGTITCNVVTDTDLASGDKDFKVAYNRKVTDYMRLITIPGECIADASYSQGMFYSDVQSNSYLLPVDFSVQTAAAGAGAALTVNVYKNTTNLFSSAPDLTTNTVLRSQRPTTNTLSAAETISLRIMSSAGATNKASGFQAKLYIVPQSIYTAF